ncbi:MAG: CDP-alcohol phosphatidyltransferase family protein [Chitinispirillaceae bacterium]|nr:CDP-alcohol phosphatidyltransferase family protein [Chitinispirillaceae bacterium]
MNSANALTLLRILIAPVFAFVFVSGSRNPDAISWILICSGLALLIEVSDALDGRIARARNMVTDFGKVFDPVADSLSRQTIFISFMIAGIIPWWLYLVFLYRDAFLQLLRIACASGGYVLAARPSGKAKAILQGIGIFGVLLVLALQAYHISWMPDTLWGFHPGFWVMIIPALYTLFSAIDYLAPNFGMIKKMMAAKE